MADPGAPTPPAETVAEHTEIKVLLLADRAEVSQGKLYIMGGAFETVFAATLPAPLQFGVALVLAIPWNETNEEHHAQLTIENTDGQQVGQLNLSFTTGRPPFLGRGEEQRVPVAVPQINATVPAFGLYLMKSTVDGRPGPRVPFHVRQLGGPVFAPQQPG